MKVGIITIHNAINYGSALQAYALRKVVENLGHDCYIVDYKNKKLEDYYRPQFFSNDIKDGLIHMNFRSSIKELMERLHNNRYWKLNKRFKLFWLNYRKKTKPIYSIESLVNYKFGALICGSDQIWEPGITGGVDRMFFCDIKDDKVIKISYAASGVLPYKDETDNYLLNKYIKNFNFISVRENEMVEYLDKMYIKNVKVVLDPTLLLDKEHWLKFVKKPKIKSDYIFVYLMWTDSEILEVVKTIENETGIKSLIISRAAEYVYFNGIKVDTSNPYAFLGLIYNAKYVISNSFHGTVFSILFNKQFFSFNSGQRIRTLLNNLEIGQRLIEFDGTRHCNMCDAINWENVRKRLQDLYDYSIGFLIEALNKE